MPGRRAIDSRLVHSTKIILSNIMTVQAPGYEREERYGDEDRDDDAEKQILLDQLPSLRKEPRVAAAAVSMILIW